MRTVVVATFLLGCGSNAGQGTDGGGDLSVADLAPVTIPCAGENQCGGFRPHCDVASGACVGCKVNQDCRGGLLCDPTTGECRDCLTDADCAPDVCDYAVSRQCSRHCMKDGDCAGLGPGHCNSLGFCVDCTTGAHCGSGFCELKTYSCVGCLVDGDCAPGESCGPSHFCTPPCAGDGDCPDGFCDTTVGKCVECATNAHCPGEVCQTDFTCG